MKVTKILLNGEDYTEFAYDAEGCVATYSLEENSDNAKVTEVWTLRFTKMQLTEEQAKKLVEELEDAWLDDYYFYVK